MLAPMVYVLVMMMDAGLKQTTSVAGLGSRGRRAERSSELSLEGFEQRLRSAPQRERAARTLPGLISHWKDKLSKMYFPNDSKSVPASYGCGNFKLRTLQQRHA